MRQLSPTMQSLFCVAVLYAVYELFDITMNHNEKKTMSLISGDFTYALQPLLYSSLKLN